MAGLPLHRVLGLEPALLQALAARRLLTAKDVLAATLLDLVEALDLSHAAVGALVHAVAAAVQPQPITALQLLRTAQTQATHLPTQLEALDVLLCGGVPFGSITELCGPSGAGKTQMCLQLTAAAATLHRTQLSAQAGAAVYFDTERKFSAQRLTDIASQRFPEVYSTAASLDAFKGRVSVVRPDSSAELTRSLQDLERDIHQRGVPVRLVVIDSVAALARHDFAHTHVADRQQLLGQQASLLKNLAERYRIPVVVTNQITTQFAGSVARHPFEDVPGGGSARASEGGHLAPALGALWAHAINTRLVMEGTKQGKDAAVVRYIKVAKSPVAPIVAYSYAISRRGVDLTSGEPQAGTKGGSSLVLAVSNHMF